MNASAELLGQRDDDALRAAHVTEPMFAGAFFPPENFTVNDPSYFSREIDAVKKEIAPLVCACVDP